MHNIIITLSTIVLDLHCGLNILFSGLLVMVFIVGHGGTMIKSGFMLIICLLCYSEFLYANDTSQSSIVLHEGNNSVKLTLFNNWNRNIHNVTVTIEDESLPSWIEAPNELESIVVLKSGDGTGTLVFPLQVTDAPENVTTDINIIIKDDAGNKWTVPVGISLINTGNTPDVFITELLSNYPNPFNPSTTISYSLQQDDHVEIVIYNSIGQRVISLLNASQTAGLHTIKWDGLDNYGNAVSSGVYICRFSTSTYTATKRMLLIE